MSLCSLFIRITLVLTLLVHATNGICCYDKCSYGYACNPAPKTSCNIFCCNCGLNKCGKEPDVCPTENKRKGAAKRKIGDGQVRLSFNIMDTNNDKVVDLNEAFVVYRNDTVPGGVSKVKLLNKKDFEKEFKKMDANKNGVLEPREYDVSLA